MIRILLADDHAALRAGLRMLIDGEPDMRVVAEAADGGEAAWRAAEVRPDVAVVDLSMPGHKGMTDLGRIPRQAPGTRVLVLTIHDDPVYAEAALSAGASGYVVKDADADELLAAIRTIHEGGTVVRLSRKPRASWPQPFTID